MILCFSLSFSLVSLYQSLMDKEVVQVSYQEFSIILIDRHYWYRNLLRLPPAFSDSALDFLNVNLTQNISVRNKQSLFRLQRHTFYIHI